MWGGAFFWASLIQKTKKKPHPPGAFREFPLYASAITYKNRFMLLLSSHKRELNFRRTKALFIITNFTYRSCPQDKKI